MKPRLSRIMILVSILVVLSLACNLSGKKEPTATPRPTIVRATRTLKIPAETPILSTDTPIPPTHIPGAAATPVPDLSLGEENRCEACGFSFRAIPGYSLDVEANTITMLAEGADPDTGPVVMLVGGPAQEGLTPEALLESFEGGDVLFSEPSDTLVGGLKGITAFVTGVRNQVEMGGQVVIILTPTQSFIAIGGSPKEQWQHDGSARFNAVLNSITFFPPVVPPVETTPVEPTSEPTAAVVAEIRQWAASATASSEYDSSDWAASQATGAPDTAFCSDSASAWTSLANDSVEWIELTYNTPVIPTQVNIVQSYNPSFVVKVELRDVNGSTHEVYVDNGARIDTCPYVLSIPVDNADYQAMAVRITIDQSDLIDWNEIDAVELVGMGAVSVVPTEAPEQAGSGAPTPEGFVTPSGFLWRVGGEISYGGDSLTPVEGMDTDGNNLLYVADSSQGIRVFDTEGEPVRLIDDPDMIQPSDVKIGPDGNVYVAAWGSNQVFIYTPEGDLVTRIGEAGMGNGQFGQFSPQKLAVGPDGRIYVYDQNKDDADQAVYRIQIFTPNGEWLHSFPLASEWDTPNGMNFGPDGNLYTVGFLSDSIVQYDSDGNLLNQLEVTDGLGGARSLDIDNAGNFYIASWDKGVLKVDPQGNLLGEWGVWAGDTAGELDWVEGTFYRPAGVAVLWDGTQVFFSDWSYMFSYIVAFEFK
jgi:hypothetical protein